MDELTEPEEAPAQPAEPVYLTTINSDQEFELFSGLLHLNKIPFFSQDKDTGDYMRIYMGFSVYGQDVYVLPQHYALCSQLLAQIGGEYAEGEVEAAYEDYMRSPEAAETPEEDPDAEPVSSGYGVLKGFAAFFGALILIWLLGKLLHWW